MIARRLILLLALSALLSNVMVVARPNASGEGQAFTLMSLKHESAGALTRIMIESNAPPLYTVFRPSDRLIIIDLPGGDAARLSPSYAVKSALVESISVRQSRLGSSTSERSVSRIEIAVRGEVRDRTAIDGNTLVLEISSAGNQTKAAAVDQPGLVETKANRKENSNAPSVYVNPAPVRARATANTPAPDRAPATQSALKPASLVQAVRSEAADKGVRVLVDMDGAAQFKDFMLPDPWRVVVDITGVTSAFGNKTFSVGAASVDRVRVGQPSGNVVRVVVDTKSKMPYRVTREGARLVIAVGQVSAAQPANTVPQPEQSSVNNREIKVAGQRVENQKTENQKEEINPNIPSNLIAQAGKPAGQSGSNQRVTAQPNTNLPLPKQPATQNPPAVKETIIQPAGPSYTRSVADVQRPAAQPSAVPSAPQSQPSKNRSELAFCDAGYVGGLISFDLRAGVDLRDMLRFVSQQYGINFIVDKSVTTVPVDIRVTDIPWNQVIDSVLRANRLGAVCESNGRIIRIATLAAIKEEEDQQRAITEAQSLKVPLVTKIIRLRYARAAGSLGDTGTGAAGRSSGSSSAEGGGLSRGTLLSIAEKRLSQRGRIEMDMRTNTLIVTDLPEYVQAVDEIIAQLDKPEPMVEIEARIVIASRNFLRDLGTSVGGAVVDPRDGKTAFLQTTPLQLQPGSKLAPGGQSSSSSNNNDDDDDDRDNSNSSSSDQKGLGPNLVGPFATNALANGLANTVLSLTTGALGTGILSMALSASETKGQIRTIASPRITAQDNQTAEIVNGVQIPVQTVSNNTITTTFVTAALRLEITPQIVEETGEVLMHVVAENNTVNFSLANQFNNGTPGINTQSAESTVRISDGGTTVMGGINIDDEGQTLTRTPGISKIPLVGELFKRRSTRRDFSEILFFITPRIVRQDGTVGPRLAPQRSSNEGVQNPAGTQRASGTPSPAQKPVQKPAQPVQANAAANKGGR